MAIARAKLRLLLLALLIGASSLTASYFLLAEQRRRFSFDSTSRLINAADSHPPDSNEGADFQSYIKKIFTNNISFPATVTSSLAANTSVGVSGLTSLGLRHKSSGDIVEPRSGEAEKIFGNPGNLGVQGKQSKVPNQPKQPDGIKTTQFNVQHNPVSKISTSSGKHAPQNIDSAASINVTNHTNRKSSRRSGTTAIMTSLERLILRPTTSVYGDSRNCPKNYWRSGLVELFRAWVEMSHKHNIEYVLAFGSLLGATRNGDVIPWDSDVDVLVDTKLFPVLEELSAERNFDSSDGVVRFVVQPDFRQEVSETRRRFTCAGKETPNMIDQCSFQEPMGRFIKGNIHIDVFHFYHTSNNRIKEPADTMTTYEKSDFFPLRPCMFLGMNSFCPNKSLKVLRTYFGQDNLEPAYKCKNGHWLNDRGRSPW